MLIIYNIQFTILHLKKKSRSNHDIAVKKYDIITDVIKYKSLVKSLKSRTSLINHFHTSHIFCIYILLRFIALYYL